MISSIPSGSTIAINVATKVPALVIKLITIPYFPSKLVGTTSSIILPTTQLRTPNTKPHNILPIQIMTTFSKSVRDVVTIPIEHSIMTDFLLPFATIGPTNIEPASRPGV